MNFLQYDNRNLENKDFIQTICIDDTFKIDILRLDKIHPIVSGNKLFKLTNYFIEAKKKSAIGIATFGGFYSNHLAATAFYCKENQMPCIGFVRGQDEDNRTPTLQFCQEQGMQLIFCEQQFYKQHKKKQGIIDELHAYANHYFIPEGGYGKLGALGMQNLFQHLDTSFYTMIVVAVGTGTTLAGICNAVQTKQIQIVGFVPMKNNLTIESETAELIHEKQHHNLVFIHDYHFGKFGKTTPFLIDFIKQFQTTHQVPLDKIYTAKAMYGLINLHEQKRISPQEKILFVHTGGLQGNGCLES